MDIEEFVEGPRYVEEFDKIKSKACEYCGGILQQRHRVQTCRLGIPVGELGQIVEIRKVPVYKCNRCKRQLIIPDTQEKLKKLAIDSLERRRAGEKHLKKIWAMVISFQGDYAKQLFESEGESTKNPR